jgi:hypothetical protein
VQPDQIQLGADSGASSNGALEFNPGTYDSPQGGLFGRLLALQAEQNGYQLGSNGLAPSVPQNPDFRQISRAPIGIWPQGAIAPSDLPGDQSNLAQPPLGADLAAQPVRSFSDRLQAAWDHPHPYGLIRMFKEATNGMEQAVQGSIDATITPSTEEEAFRQRMGHELAAIGALKALSLRAPLTPGGASGFWRGPANLAVSRGVSSAIAGINPWSPKPADTQEQSTGGPSIFNGEPLSQWPFP